MLKAKRDGKHVSVRCGGHGAEMIGRQASLCEQGKPMQVVVLTRLVKDYGEGDVCLFATDVAIATSKKATRSPAQRQRVAKADQYGTGHPWAEFDESD